MDAYSSKREIEKPRTITEKRAELAKRLRVHTEVLNGQRQASAIVLWHLSPVVGWLGSAQSLMLEALEELERGRR